MHALPSTLPAPLAHSIASVLDAPSSSSSSSTTKTKASLTAHLISLFPTPADLSTASLDKAQARLRADAQQADARVQDLIRQLDQEHHNAQSHAATLDGTAAEQAVATLLAQLGSIREKARESEVVVRDITREIRNLDTAKRNVVASMTALKRLQMLGALHTCCSHCSLCTCADSHLLQQSMPSRNSRDSRMPVAMPRQLQRWRP